MLNSKNDFCAYSRRLFPKQRNTIVVIVFVFDPLTALRQYDEMTMNGQQQFPSHISIKLLIVAI